MGYTMISKEGRDAMRGDYLLRVTSVPGVTFLFSCVNQKTLLKGGKKRSPGNQEKRRPAREGEAPAIHPLLSRPSTLSKVKSF